MLPLGGGYPDHVAESPLSESASNRSQTSCEREQVILTDVRQYQSAVQILSIDCNSLRPDHLGCYGYSRDTSPMIDDLAADGRSFTNYYVSDAPCLPSRTATTGRPPARCETWVTRQR